MNHDGFQANKKLNMLAQRGKLKKHVRDRVENIKALKSQGSRKRIHNVSFFVTGCKFT